MNGIIRVPVVVFAGFSAISGSATVSEDIAQSACMCIYTCVCIFCVHSHPHIVYAVFFGSRCLGQGNSHQKLLAANASCHF